MLNVLLVIIGSIAYVFLPIFVKNIIAYDYSSLYIVFYRYFFTAIFLFIIILVTRKSFKITKRQFIELLIFSITGLGLTFFFLSQSLLYISAGLSNMIHFGYPVIVLLIMIFLFKEKINILKNTLNAVCCFWNNSSYKSCKSRIIFGSNICSCYNSYIRKLYSGK